MTGSICLIIEYKTLTSINPKYNFILINNRVFVNDKSKRNGGTVLNPLAAASETPPVPRETCPQLR
jgi:hypothetical protein